MDPPGTHCHRAALLDSIRGLQVASFVEIGVGDGAVAKSLLARGLTGIGIERSAPAIERARATLAPEIAAGRFRLVSGDLRELDMAALPQSDLGLALMVIEHEPDDVGLLRALAALIRPGGHLLVSVPARRDRWSFEDETVGHLRRYERAHLEGVLRQAGAADITIRSVAVPVANLLYRLGNLMLARAGEADKRTLSQAKQTDLSGIRDIPYKTLFPRWCRLILNPVALYPFFIMQRLFYSSALGLELMAVARMPEEPRAAAR
ncbi:MAG: class I SAM-dependent methyltransferase [Alphaproteobacteria bacterium]|nr:class I SAM-dependent methyltransferase [Alphaproteobacteria bacterium]